jgi:hypothetical protein
LSEMGRERGEVTGGGVARRAAGVLGEEHGATLSVRARLARRRAPIAGGLTRP